MIVVFLFICLIQSCFAAFEYEYAVIIESTSGETLGNCYSWKRRENQADPIPEIVQLGSTQSTRPLHEFANELGELKHQLQPLVDYCIGVIPQESLEFTPIRIILGGGVRSLRAPLQRNLITVVHQVVRLSCFSVASEGETVILPDPIDEAIYGWVGTGLSGRRPVGSFRSVLYVDQNDAAVVSRLGQATGQFSLADGQVIDVAASAIELSVDVSPLIQWLKALGDDAPLAQEWPCLPRGFERQVNLVSRRGQALTYVVRGTSEVSQCKAVLSGLVDEARGSQALLDVPNGDVVALGGLDAAVRATVGSGIFGAADLELGVDRLCALDWPAVQREASADSTPLGSAGACERAMWIVLVVRQALDANGSRFVVEDATSRTARAGAARGFLEDIVGSLPIGAPNIGPRCEELRVPLRSTTLPRLVVYQCDCVTFVNQDRDSVHHISSDELLREVMPSFTSQFLFPERMADQGATEYRVCTDTNTAPGKYEYHCDVHEQNGMTNSFIVRPQRQTTE